MIFINRSYFPYAKNRLLSCKKVYKSLIEFELDFDNASYKGTEKIPVRDFVIVESPDYKVLNKELNGARVNVFYLPGSEKNVASIFDTVSDAISIFNADFGQYPYTELDELYDRWLY